MRVSSLLFIGLLWMFSCNQVNLEPVDPSTEPTEALQVVKTRFPNASDVVFKAIMPGDVWEVAFSNTNEKYLSLVDRTKMFETFKLRPDTLPQPLTSFMPRSTFKGGTFSDNGEDISTYQDYNWRNRLLYNLNGTDYSFEIVRNRAAPYTPVVVNFENYKYHIHLSKVDDFPAAVRDFLSVRQNVTFRAGEARVKLNFEKHYWMQVSFMLYGKEALGYLLLDEKGKLIWSSKDFNLPPNYDASSNIDTLPEPIQNYLDQTPELATFNSKPEKIYKWRSEYEGVVSYYLSMQQGDWTTPSELCELYFDQDGNLLNRRAFVSF
ncbi:hypothetical protein [Dyadobacter luticola]|uniref:Uncharacterized protein n=1 Tax=Dyadobacter luticola TaxID=1979387 RepID=A0A5R9L299_9BACT|nr:hypothetical protein [Dyadobacter luticola]TLV02702.1 hypothetical protein FEN17_03525 [Dyadobacter luticola]